MLHLERIKQAFCTGYVHWSLLLGERGGGGGGDWGGNLLYFMLYTILHIVEYTQYRYPTLEQTWHFARIRCIMSLLLEKEGRIFLAVLL